MVSLLLFCSLQADEAAAAELQRQQNDAAERKHFEALQCTYGMAGKVMHTLPGVDLLQRPPQQRSASTGHYKGPEMLILDNFMLLRVKEDAIAAMKRATGLESVPETRTMQSESCFCNVMCLLTHPALALSCMAGTFMLSMYRCLGVCIAKWCNISTSSSSQVVA